MATVRVSGTFCPGGGHAHITLTVNGTPYGPWTMLLEELQQVPDDAGKAEFAKTMVRLVNIGQTTAQTKADLQAGVQVTL